MDAWEPFNCGSRSRWSSVQFSSLGVGPSKRSQNKSERGTRYRGIKKNNVLIHKSVILFSFLFLLLFDWFYCVSPFRPVLWVKKKNPKQRGWELCVCWNSSSHPDTGFVFVFKGWKPPVKNLIDLQCVEWCDGPFSHSSAESRKKMTLGWKRAWFVTLQLVWKQVLLPYWAYTSAMRRLEASSAHTVSMKACRLQADLAPHSVSGAQNTRSDS